MKLGHLSALFVMFTAIGGAASCGAESGAGAALDAGQSAIKPNPADPRLVWADDLFSSPLKLRTVNEKTVFLRGTDDKASIKAWATSDRELPGEIALNVVQHSSEEYVIQLTLPEILESYFVRVVVEAQLGDGSTIESSACLLLYDYASLYISKRPQPKLEEFDSRGCSLENYRHVLANGRD